MKNPTALFAALLVVLILGTFDACSIFGPLNNPYDPSNSGAAVTGSSTTVTGGSGASGASYLYVTDPNADRILVFRINTDGSLQQLSGSPFATGSYPEGVAVTPNDQYLYALNAKGDNISGYTIGSDGTLTELSGSPFAFSGSPQWAVVAPDGEYLYVLSSSNLTSYSIATDGSLSIGSSTALQYGGETAAVTPDGRYLYVGTQGNTVLGFTLNGDGSFTQLGGSPFAAGQGTFGTVITPDGGHLYVTDASTGEITGYTIAADGSLTQLGASPFYVVSPSQEYGVNQEAVSSDGNYLYVAVLNGVSAFSIGADGSLSMVSGSPFSSRGGAGIVVSPDGKDVYATDFWLSGLSVASDGSLSQFTEQQVTAGNQMPGLVGIALATK